MAYRLLDTCVLPVVENRALLNKHIKYLKKEDLVKYCCPIMQCLILFDEYSQAARQSLTDVIRHNLEQNKELKESLSYLDAASEFFSMFPDILTASNKKLEK